MESFNYLKVYAHKNGDPPEKIYLDPSPQIVGYFCL